MPWCPKCKNEYIDGIEVCSDCGCKLVESLEEELSEPLTFGTEEEIDALIDFLTYSKVKGVQKKWDERDQIYELYVSASDQKKAVRYIQLFESQSKLQKKNSQSTEEEEDFLQMPETDLSEESTEEEPTENGEEEDSRLFSGKQVPTRGVYQAASKRAEEYKSGAVTLLFTGVVGFVLLILLLTGIIPLNLAVTTKYLAGIVMGALFLVFIIMGILSFRSYKELEGKAVKENNLKEELLRWCHENMTTDSIDREFSFSDSDSEEMKYFKRSAKMKKMITENFLHLEEGYLDSFVDELYPDIFETEEDNEENL